MSVQPTASKTDLLFQCPRPFSKGVETEAREASEAANWGVAVHAALAEILTKRLPQDRPRTEIIDAAIDAACEISRWSLAETNPLSLAWSVVPGLVERPLARRLGRLTTSRSPSFDAGTHTYDLKPGEFAGTPDVVLRSNQDDLLVLDLKTGYGGETFSDPGELPQLLTLLSLLVAWRVRHARLFAGIIWMPRGQAPTIYVDEVSPERLKAHEKKLSSALKMIDSGYLRPGPCCKYCPARASCPANDGELIARSTAIVKAASVSLEKADTSSIDPGELHLVIGAVERVTKRAREIIRERVRGGEIIVRPDGKRLVLTQKSVESVSKTSIQKALKDRAGEVLDELRKAGAVVTSTREELRAEEHEDPIPRLEQ